MVDKRSIHIDSNYLLNDQYKNAQNLAARAQLHVRFSTNKNRWQRWLFDQFDFPPDAKVIEFGTGPSWLWAENLDRIPAGWDITLTDFSPGMIDESKRNLAQIARPFKHEVVDVQSIPYPDATFDAVIANHMLYHVPDLQKGISEMRRILKPTGKLVTATNGENHLREIFELQARFDSQVIYWEGFSAARSFELDNGQAILQQFFPQVTLKRYPDSLVVTEVQPLIDYLLSAGNAAAQIVDAKLAELRQFIQHEIDVHGSIHIIKDSGVLISSFA
jgi:ubiquinone/menaquinone biosynthesis C-methylase UbiE